LTEIPKSATKLHNKHLYANSFAHGEIVADPAQSSLESTPYRKIGYTVSKPAPKSTAAQWRE
jgi:hypothetical protein